MALMWPGSFGPDLYVPIWDNPPGKFGMEKLLFTRKAAALSTYSGDTGSDTSTVVFGAYGKFRAPTPPSYTKLMS